MHWLQLFLAVMAEVIGTTALKASVGFTRPGAVAVVVLAYGTAFYLLARVLLVLPLGVTYAIWSGLGVAAVTVIGWTVYGQKLDTAAWGRHRPDRGGRDGAEPRLRQHVGLSAPCERGADSSPGTAEAIRPPTAARAGRDGGNPG